MSTQTDAVVTREESARAGEHIYEQRLKAVLEPGHAGRVVAIHVPSQDYFLGDSLLEASDHLRDKHPHAARGDVYARGISERVLMRARTRI
jgi:hypothetical protein